MAGKPAPNPCLSRRAARAMLAVLPCSCRSCPCRPWELPDSRLSLTVPSQSVAAVRARLSVSYHLDSGLQPAISQLEATLNRFCARTLLSKGREDVCLLSPSAGSPL